MKKLLFIFALLLIPNGVFAATQKFEFYTGGFYVGSYENAYGSGVQYAQPFTTSAAHTVTSIKAAVFRNGYPAGGPGGYNFILKLYAADTNHKPTGSVLATGIFASANAPTTATSDGTPYEFVLDNEALLASSTEYVFVILAPDAVAPGNYGSVHTFSGGTLPAPNGWITSDGGNTWTPSISESALFEVWGNANAATNLLSGPTSLTATAISSSSISIAWTDNATNEDGYQIERSFDGATFTEIATTTANISSYTDTALTPATIYYYRVRAFNTEGMSIYSNVSGVATGLESVGPGVIFQDDFTRPDSLALGSAQVGGVWGKGNELFSQTVSASGQTQYPAHIELRNGSLQYRYAPPDPIFCCHHAQPYAYAPMATGTPGAVMTFTYTPNGFGRVTQSVGLMSASSGFVTNQGVPLDQFPAYHPVKGLSVNLSRSSFSYNNSSINLIKFDGTQSNLIEQLYLPFQFDAGVSYAFTLTMANNELQISVSNGAQVVSTSVSLDGFAPVFDQVFIQDEQEGGDGLSFDNMIVAATSSTPSPVVNPPAAPSDLVTVALSSSAISLAWTDNALNEDGYQIERSSDGVTFDLIASTSASVTGYTDTALTPATAYYYCVRAVNSGGSSDYSSVSNITTLPLPPATPSDFVAAALSSSSISLAWTDNATNEDVYVIERSLDNVNWFTIATATPNTIDYSDSSLSPMITYYYRIYTLNSGGVSGAVSAFATTLPIAPSEPTLLEVNRAINPIDVRTPKPSFTAIFQDASSTALATSYEILVMSGSAVYWDSGKKTYASSTPVGARTQQVVSGILFPRDGATYTWGIKFWDQYGNEGEWSTENASFVMHLK